MGRGLRIDGAASAPDLRRLARCEGSRPTARRMLAIANALDGLGRARAAAAAGMERQALRDAWNAMLDEKGRLRSLCLQRWIKKDITSARRYDTVAPYSWPFEDFSPIQP